MSEHPKVAKKLKRKIYTKIVNTVNGQLHRQNKRKLNNTEYYSIQGIILGVLELIDQARKGSMRRNGVYANLFEKLKVEFQQSIYQQFQQLPQMMAAIKAVYQQFKYLSQKASMIVQNRKKQDKKLRQEKKGKKCLEGISIKLTQELKTYLMQDQNRQKNLESFQIQNQDKKFKKSNFERTIQKKMYQQLVHEEFIQSQSQSMDEEQKSSSDESVNEKLIQVSFQPKGQQRKLLDQFLYQGSSQPMDQEAIDQERKSEAAEKEYQSIINYFQDIPLGNMENITQQNEEFEQDKIQFLSPFQQGNTTYELYIQLTGQISKRNGTYEN